MSDDIERLQTALRNADKAGDTEGAKALAGALSKATGWQPKEAGWGSVVGNAVMRGGVKAMSVVPFVEGGLANMVGATDTADEAFKAYEEGQKMAEYWTPGGHQSTAKQVVGGLGEMALPGMLTGGAAAGVLAPGLVTGGAERAKQGQGTAANIGTSMVEAAAGTAGMHVPFNIGGGVAGVAKAAAAQGGIALADVLARLGISSADTGNEASKKIAEQIKQNGASDVAIQVAAQAFGGSLGGLYKYLKARGKKPAVEPTPGQAEPSTPSTPPSTPEAPEPAKTAPIESASPSQGKIENPEPPRKPGFIRVYHSGSPGEGKTGRWVSTSRTYAAGYRHDLPLHYFDLPESDPRVNNPDYPDTQGIKQGFDFNFELKPEEAAQLVAMERPGPKGLRPGKAQAKETKEARAAREEQEWITEMSGAGDLSDMDTPPVGEAKAPDAAAGPEPEKSKLSRAPVFMKGDVYGQHPLVGLTDVDRLALHLHAPEQYPLANASPARAISLGAETDMTTEQLRAHGQALDEFITARHNELVGAEPGSALRHDSKWTKPEGVREPIDVHGRKPPEPAQPEPKPEVPAGERKAMPGEPGYKEHEWGEDAANRVAAEDARTETEKRDEFERSAKEAANAKLGALPASRETEEHYARMIRTTKEQMRTATPGRQQELQKNLKRFGNELAAARRAHNNALTEKEARAQQRNMYAELRKAGLSTELLKDVGRQLDIGNGWEANQRHRGMFTKNGEVRSLDGLLEWMKEKDWIQEWEAEHWDNNEPGGAKQLAVDRLEQELANSGSTVHIEDAEARAERAAMWDWAKAHGMANESVLTIKKAMLHDEEQRVLEEANALINELTEEAKGGDVDAIFRALGKTGSRAAAVTGLLAASNAARADDGSETDASYTLLWMALGVAGAGGMAYKNREALIAAFRKNASPSLREWRAKLWPDRVKETGAKTVVDKWRGRAAVMTRRVLERMPHIEAASNALKKQGVGGGEQLTAHELSQNIPFLEAVAHIADLYTKAKWKDRFGSSIRLNAALDHWDYRDPKTAEAIEAFRRHAGDDPSIDFPMFHYEAGFHGIQEGLDIGLKLRYNDAAQLFAAYGIEAQSSLARGSMLRELKNLILPNGMRGMHNPLEQRSMPNETAKPNFNEYVPIGEAWGGVLRDLEGWKIHPDLVNDFKLTFNTYEPSMLPAVLGAVSNISKRLTFESLFHARTLLDGFIGKVIGSADQGVAEQLKDPRHAVDMALKLYREGGDPIIEGVSVIDRALMHGWQLDAKPIDFRLGQDSVQSLLDGATEVLDAWVPLPKAAVRAQEALGRMLPKGLTDKLPVATAKGLGGLTTGQFRAMDKQIQRFTWEYLRPGFQIMSLLKDVEVLRATNPNLSIDEIVASAVQNSHNTFGGQDWRRLAYRFNSEFGRDVMANVLSGRGQYYLSIAMIAPDWFVSTAQTWTKALPGVKFQGWKSLPKIDLKHPDKQLAMRYLLGSAVYMAAIPNMLNYWYTGHWMWDNESEKKRGQSEQDKYWEDAKRKLQVDRGDGTFLQFNKHLSDFPEIVIDAHGGTSFPTQTALNKMAAAPRLAGELAFNQQYLSTKWAPKITEQHGIKRIPDYAEHIAEKFMPIPIDQLFGPGATAERAIHSGILGTPIRGYTPDELAQMKAAEKKRKEDAK